MEKFLKSIDLYGKLPQGLAEPTQSGAIMSIVTFFFLGLFVLSELISYITVDTSSEIFVNTITQKDKVTVNMDIQFINLPCQFLEIQVFDAMGQMLKDENQNLNFFRIDKTGNIIEGYVNNLQINNIQQKRGNFELTQARSQVENKEGCEVSGFIKVNQVPGKIQFGPHRNHHQVQQVERGLILDVSHRFKHLSFGEDSELQKVKKEFNEGQLNTLEGNQRIKAPQFKTTPIQHEHYVSIVPTIYQKLNKQSFKVYQYTANHNEVRAQYDISPVTVKFWQTKESILEFLVQLCAILGGLFTVSSMVESLIHTMMIKLLKV